MTAHTIDALPILLFGLLLKGTLLMLVAWAVCRRIRRRSSAATRHLIWSAAIGGVLLLPLLTLTIPNWNITWVGPIQAPPVMPVPSVVRMTSTVPPVHPVAAQPAPMSVSSQPAPAKVSPQVKEPRVMMANPHKTHILSVIPPKMAVPTVAPISAAPMAHPIPIAHILVVAGLGIWIIGFLVLLAQMAIGLGRIGRVRRLATSLDGTALQIAEKACREMGLHRRITFLQATDSNTIAVPVTWGVIRPIILLPMQSGTWSGGCMRAALLHELAHVQRWDWPTQLMVRVTCALYWWHPLVWAAARHARAECERACDDCVLGVGLRPAEYAQRLVEVVRSMPVGAPSRSIAIAMAQPSEVEGRLKAVLSKGQVRAPMTSRRVIISMLLLTVLLLPLAAIRLKAASTLSDKTSQSINRSPIFKATPAGRYLTGDSDTYVDKTGVIFHLAGAQNEQVAIANGTKAVLPNGYLVEVMGVTREISKGRQWQLGGPSWRPDGGLLSPTTLPKTADFTGWPVKNTKGVAPYFTFLHVTPPTAVTSGDPASMFLEVSSTANPDWLPPFVRLPETPVGKGKTIAWGGCFPAKTATCSVRCGIATGPWTVQAVMTVSKAYAAITRLGPSSAHEMRQLAGPVLILDDKPKLAYQTSLTHWQTDYFLGRDSNLTCVARRFVAVDHAGNRYPLQESASGEWEIPFMQISLTGSSSSGKVATPLPLAQIHHILLETRSYQMVEFPSIPLSPSHAHEAQSVSTPHARKLTLPHVLLADATVPRRQWNLNDPPAPAIAPVPPASLREVPAKARLAPQPLPAIPARALAAPRAIPATPRAPLAPAARLRTPVTPLAPVAPAVRSGNPAPPPPPALYLPRTNTPRSAPPARRNSGTTTRTGVPASAPRPAPVLPSVSEAPATPDVEIEIDNTETSDPQTPDPQPSASTAAYDPDAADGPSDGQPEEKALRRVTAGWQKGINSRADVCNAAIAVARAHIQAAIDRDQFTNLGSDLAAIVAQRQQLLTLIQTQYQAGISTMEDVNSASADLAEARSSVDLYEVVTARQKSLDLAATLVKSGVATDEQTTKAQTAVDKAERIFLESFTDD